MDYDKKLRRHNTRVIISEALMVIITIVVVIILAFIVSGYWVNANFEVERQGMLQISSMPKGASLEVDGISSWMTQTDTSKILASGEHQITLRKDGYDTWSREIKISDGLLYRIRYPRLFLSEDIESPLYDVTGNLVTTISPDRHTLLLINSTTEWTLLRLDRDTPEKSVLRLPQSFPAVNRPADAAVGEFTGQILSLAWDYDNRHILLNINTSNGNEWILLDTKDPEKSQNLTKNYQTNFTQIEIFDHSANILLASFNGNLYKIIPSGTTLSTPLIQDVTSYSFYDGRIIFLAKNPAAQAKNQDDDSTISTSLDSTPDTLTVSAQPAQYLVGITNIDDSAPRILEYLAEPARPAILQFYDEKYLAILQGSQLTLYREKDFSESASYTISFIPDQMVVSEHGDYITMSQGAQIATLDMEATTIREWRVDGDEPVWLENGLIYSVADGNLCVYDFDGQNRRIIASGVSAGFPVVITNDKWLYFVRDGKLIRKIIMK